MTWAWQEDMQHIQRLFGSILAGAEEEDLGFQAAIVPGDQSSVLYWLINVANTCGPDSASRAVCWDSVRAGKQRERERVERRGERLEQPRARAGARAGRTHSQAGRERTRVDGQPVCWLGKLVGSCDLPCRERACDGGMAEGVRGSRG
eukprot:3294928-Rhodomonas_salina.1